MTDAQVVETPDGIDGLASIISEMDKGDSEESQPNTALKPEEHAETHSEGVDEATVESGTETEAESVEETAKGGEAETDDTAIEVQLPDGTIEKVVMSELKKGYQRQADYTRKQTEMSEARKREETEVLQIKQQQLQTLTALNDRYKQLDPVGILETQRRQAVEIGDDAETNRLGLAIIETKQHLGEMQAAQEKLAEEDKGKREAFVRSAMAEEYKQLSTKLPGFDDPAKREVYKGTITKALQHAGYTLEEISNIGSSKAAHLAYLAGKHLETLDAKPKVAQALKGKAVAAKTGARKSGAANSSKIEAAERQLAKNPRSIDGFGALLNAHGV